MRAALVLLTVAACGGPHPAARIQHQAATLAQSADDSWSEGSAVYVGQTGSFMFPQPLSLRLSLIDRDADDGTGLPTELSITAASIEAYGTPTFEVVTEPTCQPTYCDAELRITGPGANMLQVTLTGNDGDEPDCFYHALFEDADPPAVIEAHRAEVEAEEANCMQAL